MPQFATNAFLPTCRPLPLFPTTYSQARFKCSTTQTIDQQVPRSVPEVINLASQSLQQHLESSSESSSHLRITAEIPGLDPRLENTFPYNEALLSSLVLQIVTATPCLTTAPVRLLFASSGGAAAAAQVYRKEKLEVPENIALGTYARELVRSSNDEVESDMPGVVNVVVHPSDRRGDKLWTRHESMSTNSHKNDTWILFNEELGKDGIIGIKEREAVTKFLNLFESCFYYRGLYLIQRPLLIPVEVGALLSTQVDKWRVMKLTGGRYHVLREFTKMPTRDQMENLTDDLLKKPVNPAYEAERKKSLDDTGYLIVLGGLSFATLALVWYLKFLQGTALVGY